MDRQIVCLAIPSFEVALARLNDSTLRTRPLAIAPLNTSRALLREVSREAAQDGLYVGMSLEHARRLCPSLHVLSPNSNRVRQAEGSLLKAVLKAQALLVADHLIGARLADINDRLRAR